MQIGPEPDEDEDEPELELPQVDEDDDEEMPYTVPKRDKAKEATIILSTGDVDGPQVEVDKHQNANNEPERDSEPTTRKEKRKFIEPPTQDEYLWAWKVNPCFLMLFV